MENAFSTAHFVYLLQGMVWTIALSLLAFVLGGLLGFCIMLLRISRSPILRWLAFIYIQIVQGTPLLIILFGTYFGLSMLGIELPAIVAAAVSLMIYSSAFIGEIWRGSVEAVHKKQWEAAECLALTRIQTMYRVIFPQAVRIAVPPTVGFMVQVVKGTSLATVVGFIELTRAAQIINNSIYQPFLVFMVVGAMYFALCYPLSMWSKKLEAKFNVGRR